MSSPQDASTIAFIGGGNMCSAITGGLIAKGWPAEAILVVDPSPSQRAQLERQQRVYTLEAPGPSLAEAEIVVWAVKPQSFADAAAAAGPFVGRALQLSVMAGIRSQALVSATGTQRVVRAMPNTPALIGRGMAGLYARAGVDAADRSAVERVLAPTGELMWFPREDDLDAVTALSGSGPAYVFYVLEALVNAAQVMGLDEAQGRRLAIETFAGATELARRSEESLAVLRERVTSKGGTTHAALTQLEAAGLAGAFEKALLAAQQRARELGQSIG